MRGHDFVWVFLFLVGFFLVGLWAFFLVGFFLVGLWLFFSWAFFLWVCGLLSSLIFFSPGAFSSRYPLSSGGFFCFSLTYRLVFLQYALIVSGGAVILSFCAVESSPFKVKLVRNSISRITEYRVRSTQALWGLARAAGKHLGPTRLIGFVRSLYLCDGCISDASDIP